MKTYPMADFVAGVLALVGWLMVGGAGLAILAMGAEGVFFAVALVPSGVLLIAAGQLVNALVDIAQNTERTAVSQKEAAASLAAIERRIVRRAAAPAGKPGAPGPLTPGAKGGGALEWYSYKSRDIARTEKGFRVGYSTFPDLAAAQRAVDAQIARERAKGESDAAAQAGLAETYRGAEIFRTLSGYEVYGQSHFSLMVARRAVDERLG